eukprot:TRINITY_DN5579_c0_g1_i1.p1 TRINITY_DN5579_c0_g1~~TRINITY_DN5579_c0_g1_i1.p1  ORF type:complete len:359 (-),score=65.92 TRINITY_DN5579_c0_g1_i1:62-1105(-)
MKSVFKRATAPNIKDFYDMGEELGAGSFSRVVKALDKRSERDVAVKIIEKSRLGENEDSLKNEVAILRQVQHPNILHLHDFYESSKRYYLVMELMTGGELFDRIVERGSYTEKDACAVTTKVIEAIQYLHSKGIVHRDLKPENLLYASTSDDSEIKIADFGFAKYMGGADALTMTACGTPGYVAPEVLQNEGYSKNVDMWSVGVILYILLCGFPPFYEENMSALFSQIMSGNYSFPDPYWTHISSSAKDLISHLLVVDASKRYNPEQALAHPWIAGAQASGEHLPHMVESLKKTLARGRMRKAQMAVIAINRLSLAVGGKGNKDEAKRETSEPPPPPPPTQPDSDSD